MGGGLVDGVVHVGYRVAVYRHRRVVQRVAACFEGGRGYRAGEGGCIGKLNIHFTVRHFSADIAVAGRCGVRQAAANVQAASQFLLAAVVAGIAVFVTGERERAEGLGGSLVDGIVHMGHGVAINVDCRAVQFVATGGHAGKRRVGNGFDGINRLVVAAQRMGYLNIVARHHFGFCRLNVGGKLVGYAFHIADIGGVAVGVAAAGHVGDLFIACINTSVGHARAAGDGQAAVVHRSVAGFQAACIAQIHVLRKFEAQCVVSLVGHHADVVVGERASGTAFHVERGAERAFHGGAAVAVKLERIGGLGSNVIKLAAVDGVGGRGRNFTRGNVFDLALVACRTDGNLRTIRNLGGTGKTAVGHAVHGSTGYCRCIGACLRTCADSHCFFFVSFRTHANCCCTDLCGSCTRAESSGKRACGLGFHTHGNRSLSRFCALITSAHRRAGQALVIRVHLGFG